MDEKPKMTCREKALWIAAIAATLLIEGVLIALAYETGIMDTIKGLFRQ